MRGRSPATAFRIVAGACATAAARSHLGERKLQPVAFSMDWSRLSDYRAQVLDLVPR
jgi:hypothetical protein